VGRAVEIRRRHPVQFGRSVACSYTNPIGGLARSSLDFMCQQFQRLLHIQLHHRQRQTKLQENPPVCPQRYNTLPATVEHRNTAAALLVLPHICRDPNRSPLSLSDTTPQIRPCPTNSLLPLLRISRPAQLPPAWRMRRTLSSPVRYVQRSCPGLLTDS